MNNLKIKVNSPEESERAQRAFFALGGRWFTQSVQRSTRSLASDEIAIFLESDGQLMTCSTERTFEEEPHEEVTLAELEEVAAKVKQMGECIHSALTAAGCKRVDAPDCQVSISWQGKDEIAQARYDDAKNWFIRQRLATELTEIYTNVDKALRIAAGLETVDL